MADLRYGFLLLSLCGQGWDLGIQVYLYIVSWTFSYEEKDILLVEKWVSCNKSIMMVILVIVSCYNYCTTCIILKILMINDIIDVENDTYNV
jgi:hypothetical protein